MNTHMVLETPFVVDAETLEFYLENASQNPITAAIDAAISSKELLVTFASMVQLKENCPLVFDKLIAADLKAVRRNDLIEPTRTMLEEVKATGQAVSVPLHTKIYALALAKNKGCYVLTVDCRPTTTSTSSLASVFGVDIICVGSSPMANTHEPKLKLKLKVLP